MPFHEPNPLSDSETMRELARRLFSQPQAEETTEEEADDELQPVGGIRKVVLRDNQAVTAPLPSQDQKEDKAQQRFEAMTASGSDPTAPLAEHPMLSEQPLFMNDSREDPLEVDFSDDQERPGQLSPAEILTDLPKPGFRKSEIRKTMLQLQDGTLRPAFHVSRSPRRFAGLRDALEFSRHQLPLPCEMQLAQQPAHRTWLIAQINHCPDQQALSNFAFSLDYKDLATLFPALATLKRGEEIDRIISIIMMRASHYLYIHGWVTLQYAYPRSTVQKGLAELCEVLEKQRRQERKNHADPNEGLLPPLRLGPERFDWKSIRMISEISLPNTRHFLASMIRFIRESGISGDDFFNRYGIYRELPLGQAISSQWEMAMFEENLNRSSGSVSPVRKLFSTSVEVTGMQEF